MSIPTRDNEIPPRLPCNLVFSPPIDRSERGDDCITLKPPAETPA